MRLMNSIRIFVAKLVEDSSDFVIVLGGDEFTDDTFESEKAVSGRGR